MGRFAAIKAQARRAVHTAFSFDATYQDRSLTDAVPITVRWHNRLVIQGDYDSSGYANVIDGIERVIFNREELATLGIKPVQNAVIIITEEGYEGTTLFLDQKEAHVGPVEEKWWVKRSI